MSASSNGTLGKATSPEVATQSPVTASFTTGDHLTPEQKIVRACVIIGVKTKFFHLRLARILIATFESTGRFGETMATNGAIILYNAHWVGGCTVQEIAGVLVHELLHIVNGHHLRRGHREPGRWNRAADYAINPLIIRMGYQLPAGVLIRDDFDGMSAERIYMILESEEQEPPEEPEQDEPEQDEPEQGDDEESGESEQGASDEADEESGDEEQGGDDDNGESSDGDSAGSDDTGDSDNGDDADAEGDGDSGDSDSGTDADGSGPDGDSGDSQTDDSDTDGGGSPTTTDGADGKEPGRPKVGEVPWGEVWDAETEDGDELDPEQKAEAKAELEQQNFKDIIAERIAGEGPGGLVNHVTKPDPSEEHYEEHVLAHMKQKVPAMPSWNRRNKRFLRKTYTLPTMDTTPNGIFVAMLDTSGSMWFGDRIEVCASLITRCIEQINPIMTYIIYADDCVQHVQVIERNEPVDLLEYSGGGGTSFDHPFVYVEKEGIMADVALYCTDGYGDVSASVEPDYPVIWACAGSTPNCEGGELFGEVVEVIFKNDYKY